MVDNENSAEVERNALASLEILTGSARGTASWLSGTALDISLNEENSINIAESGSKTFSDGIVARLHRSGEGYEIEACEQNPLWVNGEKVDSKQLEQRDLIEFGDKGPLSRYRVHLQGDRVRRSLGDMLDDFVDYTRFSRKPRFARLQKAFRDFCVDFALETTLVFRLSVIVILVALVVIVYQQYRTNLELQQQAERNAYQLEDFARALTRSNEDSLRPSDLNRLRQELSLSLTDAAERLNQLEQRSAASTRIIAAATRSVAFLQGSYAFRDIETKRMLRYQTDEDGNALFTLRSQPLLTLEGEGKIAERQFTGTGFIVSNNGALLTNRHVALPWEGDNNDAALIAQGMEPVLVKFLGYLPGIEAAFSVKLLKASDEADLAVLLCTETISGLQSLKLAIHSPEPGDEVIVMGYPTGMRSMLAQTGDSFLADLQKDDGLDFWAVAERLSTAQFIRPLSSRGIIGQRSESTLVYDADTTLGGSGGPVLDTNGNAIAVNTAIIPDYGGSNFGVPIKYARRLLADAGITIE